MTENEAIEAMQFDLRVGGEIHSQVLHDAVDVAIQALEEVQQYHAIGTLEELQDMKSNYFEALSDWRQYRKIGTLEECRVAMEKQTAISREIIEDNYVCPKCHNLMPYPGYCGCGQRLY